MSSLTLSTAVVSVLGSCFVAWVSSAVVAAVLSFFRHVKLAAGAAADIRGS